MRSVRTHAVFLAIMLVVAYQAWSPNDTASANINRDGDFTVWEVSSDEVTSMTFQRDNRTTTLERRRDSVGTYLWGTSLDTPTRGAADSVTGDSVTMGSVITPTPQEFPVGEEGEDIWDRVAHLRALRDLGVLEDSTRSIYSLDSISRHLTVRTGSGERALEIGGTVYGSIHRYAYEPQSNRGYVVADQLIRALEGGPTSLRLQTLHRFGQNDVGTVTLRNAAGASRTMRRRPGTSRPADVWVSPDTPDEPDQTFQTFINHIRQLAFTGYDASVNVDTLELVMHIDYQDMDDESLGFMRLYRVPSDQPDVYNYYLLTNDMRIPALAHQPFAQRVDQELVDLF